MAVAALEIGLDRGTWLEEIPASLRESVVGEVVDAMLADLEYPFTLDTFAEIANYSPYHFARMFRSVTGIPPGEFLSALRFERAKELVLTTELSVTEICFEVGFSSLGTFSSRFKQLVGANPAQLRALPALIGEMPRHDGGPIQLGEAVPGGRVEGAVEGSAPGSVDATIYIGLFPTAIAQSAPVCGTRIEGGGAFTLPPVPKGTFRLMAAALPGAFDPLTQLLPPRTIEVAADPEPVAVQTGRERIRRTLRLRPLRKVEPPILVALPALALNRATRAWR